jgi:excisionase family DNA binding protein
MPTSPPAPETETLLLTANDVARELRIGRTLAYQLIAAGELPAIKIGRAVRVPRQALIEWVVARSCGESTP